MDLALYRKLFYCYRFKFFLYSDKAKKDAEKLVNQHLSQHRALLAPLFQIYINLVIDPDWLNRPKISTPVVIPFQFNANATREELEASIERFKDSLVSVMFPESSPEDEGDCLGPIDPPIRAVPLASGPEDKGECLGPIDPYDYQDTIVQLSETLKLRPHLKKLQSLISGRKRGESVRDRFILKDYIRKKPGGNKKVGDIIYPFEKWEWLIAVYETNKRSGKSFGHIGRELQGITTPEARSKGYFYDQQTLESYDMESYLREQHILVSKEVGKTYPYSIGRTPKWGQKLEKTAQDNLTKAVSYDIKEAERLIKSAERGTFPH